MIQSCGWCHEMNDLSASLFCATCGHRADLPRMECDCDGCGQVGGSNSWTAEREQERQS